MNNEATFNPNELHPSEIAGLALTDPKLKLSNRVRKALHKQRWTALAAPPFKKREPRICGVSAALDKANAKRDARRREGPGAPKVSAKPEGDRIVEQLSRKTMVGLIRFVCRSARRAATAKYISQKTSGPFAEMAGNEQLRQLALFRAGERMIEHRVNPPISNEV